MSAVKPWETSPQTIGGKSNAMLEMWVKDGKEIVVGAPSRWPIDKVILKLHLIKNGWKLKEKK